MRMRKFLDKLYRNQSNVYKYFLYFLSICFIVFFFPKGGKFKYEFQKGKPWQYENLYAPFDFSIKKSAEEIDEEKNAIEANLTDYYSYNETIAEEAKSAFQQKINSFVEQETSTAAEAKHLATVAQAIIDSLYAVGILRTDSEAVLNKADFYLVKQNKANRISANEIRTIKDVRRTVTAALRKEGLQQYSRGLGSLMLDVVRPNVFFNESLTNKVLQDEFSKISYTRGHIDEGKFIIAKGEVVEADNFNILNSLREEYMSELWTAHNYYFILFGYTVLVALVLIMLFLFIKRYRREIFDDNRKVTFIIFNVLLMVFITTLVVKYNETYVFIVPLCILPIILKTFFDARLGLFAHVLSVLILGFVVPNSFEYIFLQIIAGIVTILTVSEMHKRSNLFISVGQITLIYILGYLAFHVIHEGTLENIKWETLVVFVLNGVITLAFAQPLIYVYEKAFGLVSDVSLLELSDTNSKLLKELSNKAPGTFHHSLQVANLAEAAANEIGANAMLVRVGALYHDIGKMNRPTYFTENQVTNVNPHDELSPIESAKIIVGHVIAGIEIARKNNLPDRIIDFIRTHHGTSMVYYFYKKQEELEGEVNEADFKYPGPLPFSKETAILMISDAVEAASKSLKNPTYTIINEFVDKIVAGQMKANQFLNANITLREIEAVKKVLKLKLTNIYHLRVEYPE